MIWICDELDTCFNCGLCDVTQNMEVKPCESTFCLGCKYCKELATKYAVAQLKVLVLGEI